MNDRNHFNRRTVLAGAATSATLAAMPRARAQGAAAAAADRVYICNEDSNTLSVIDPQSNTVVGTVNLTSFDEDPRPPFRFVTGGVMPTHVAMAPHRSRCAMMSNAPLVSSQSTRLPAGSCEQAQRSHDPNHWQHTRCFGQMRTRAERNCFANRHLLQPQ